MTSVNVNNEAKLNGLLSNTFYSFLINYSIYIVTIVLTFIKARFLTQNEWGVLILSLSIISIWIIIIDLFPPGLAYSLSYYIPKYLGSGESFSLKSLIGNSLKQKIIILLPLFLIGLIIINFLPIYYLENLVIFYILAPQVIFTTLNTIFNSIFYGYKLFRTLFLIQISIQLIHTLSYFLLIIFGLFNILSISVVLTVKSIITLILKMFILRKKVDISFKKNKFQDNFKEDLKKNIKYGTPLFISGQMNSLWNELKKQSVGYILNPSSVTIYNIGENTVQIPLMMSLSFQQPIISHFSGLKYEKEKYIIKRQFTLMFEFALILTCFLSGSFIFLMDFYVFIIYGNDYFIYIFYFQLILISAITRVLGGLLTSLLRARNRVKIIPLLNLIYHIFLISAFYIGIFHFQLRGYAYLLILGTFIIFLIQIRFTNKLGGIKLSIKKIILILINFSISFVISYIIIYFIIPEIFLLSSIIGVALFIILFFFQMIFYKILTIKDLELIESIFKKDTKAHKLLIKVTNILKKLMRG